MPFRHYQFECVSSFKYLGIHFDTVASPTYMLKNLCLKANKAFYWLVNFVGRNHWNVAQTRLVLHDVYVRSIL